jgi:hypothetical protein
VRPLVWVLIAMVLALYGVLIPMQIIAGSF